MKFYKYLIIPRFQCHLSKACYVKLSNHVSIFLCAIDIVDFIITYLRIVLFFYISSDWLSNSYNYFIYPYIFIILFFYRIPHSIGTRLTLIEYFLFVETWARILPCATIGFRHQSLQSRDSYWCCESMPVLQT